MHLSMEVVVKSKMYSSFLPDGNLVFILSQISAEKITVHKAFVMLSVMEEDD